MINQLILHDNSLTEIFHPLCQHEGNAKCTQCGDWVVKGYLRSSKMSPFDRVHMHDMPSYSTLIEKCIYWFFHIGSDMALCIMFEFFSLICFFITFQ